jgi:alkanesulfonate monooxygenase SsuD/methylene tetrahydromethanopterin reductase-like flavin-dependent oxidoreductase (luciferase family)
MRHAVGLPNVGDYGDPSLLVDLAGQAEAAGWDGVFVWDHVAYRERGWPVADPYLTVTAIAAATARVRLGVLASALPRRRPWKLARETATLDVLSGGRLVVGVGLGSQAEEEFAAFGEDGDPRVRADKLDEGLAILDGLWRGEPFSHGGRHYRVAETVFLPRPLQRPRIPVWVAGRWPNRRPFRRAARWDGVFPTHAEVGHADTMTPAQLEEIVRYTRARRPAGLAPLEVVVEGHTGGQDPAADRARVAALEAVGLSWWIEKLGWFNGPVATARRRIQAGPPRR